MGKLNPAHDDVKWIDGKRVATPEYRSWQMMKNRCLNPRAGDFKYYGGRGIKVCERWLKFENFLEDMGRKPEPDLTLDRKKVNRGYYKQNCHWASRAHQARNRTDTRFSEFKAAKIRALYATGKYRQVDIANMFETTQAAISQITRNAAWREIGGAQ